MKNRVYPRTGRDVLCLFTNDLFGGEWNAESQRRLQTYLDLWDKAGPFFWIASGGVQNKDGLSIAQSIIDMVTTHDERAIDYLIGSEEVGVDTWTQLERIKEIFDSYRANNFLEDIRLFVVSDRLHLWNILRIGRTIDLPLHPILSPLSGNFIYKFGRFYTEVVRFLVGLIDPHYQNTIWVKIRQKRVAKAATMEPGQKYFHL